MTTRKLPSTLLLMIMIVSTVSFLPMQEARAAVEIAYDDGVPEIGLDVLTLPFFLAVKFSLPEGCTNAKLITARIYKMEPPTTLVNIHILGSDGVTELTPPFSYDVALNNAWNEIALTSKDITVTGDFWVAVEFLTTHDPLLGLDLSSTAGHSYSAVTLGEWYPFANGNTMIRVVIECGAPVGGLVMPTNKLVILAPYLALAGLVVAISAVVVVKKRR